jgi:hypothetical protein
MALNTHELLGSNGERFLERHPPRYLDAFDGWSTVKMADADGVSVRTFSVSTPYTVTSFPNMSRHHLIACEPAGRRGTIAVKSRTFSFVCASASSQQKPL